MIELPNKIDKSELAEKPRVTFDGIVEEIDAIVVGFIGLIYCSDRIFTFDISFFKLKRNTLIGDY